MKKIILTTLLLFAFVLTIGAQDNTQRLVVWQKSGEKVYFDLTEEPRTSFRGGLLVISTNTMETSYQRSNILRYTYEGAFDGIDAVETRDLTVMQSNDGITLKNVPKGTAVRLYDPAGRLLETKTSDGVSPVQFVLAGYAAGIYLVNMNDQTFKISRR